LKQVLHVLADTSWCYAIFTSFNDRNNTQLLKKQVYKLQYFCK